VTGRVVTHADAPRSYVVNTSNGSTIRRNRSQINVVPNSTPSSNSEPSEPIRELIMTRSRTGTKITPPQRLGVNIQEGEMWHNCIGLYLVCVTSSFHASIFAVIKCAPGVVFLSWFNNLLRILHHQGATAPIKEQQLTTLLQAAQFAQALRHHPNTLSHRQCYRT